MRQADPSYYPPDKADISWISRLPNEDAQAQARNLMGRAMLPLWGALPPHIVVALAGQTALELTSAADEREYGDWRHLKGLAENSRMELVSTPKTEVESEALRQRLQVPEDHRLHITRNLNAAAEGGHLYLEEGFLEEPEAVLAFAVGHELDHLAHRDPISTAGALHLTFELASADVLPENRDHVRALLPAWRLKRAKQEDRADKAGVEKALQVEPDPGLLADFFQRDLGSPSRLSSAFRIPGGLSPAGAGCQSTALKSPPSNVAAVSPRPQRPRPCLAGNL